LLGLFSPQSWLITIETLSHLNRIKADKSLKKKILIAYLKLRIASFLKIHKQHNNTSKVLEFDISYFHYNTFRYLFDTIFMQLQYYFQLKKENPLIIDCGSNIGISILFFKLLYPEAYIVGFEPDETTFKKLQENIRKNSLKKVELHRKALSDTEGLKEFYYYPDHPGSLSMSLIQEREEKKCQKVESVVLSKYINKTVDFLKLDVEGAEIGVLQELNDSDKLRQIQLMAIDYHHHFEHHRFTQQNDNLSKILGILEDSNFGYQIQADLEIPVVKGYFQPIHIYAYQKKLSQ